MFPLVDQVLHHPIANRFIRRCSLPPDEFLEQLVVEGGEALFFESIGTLEVLQQHRFTGPRHPGRCGAHFRPRFVLAQARRVQAPPRGEVFGVPYLTPRFELLAELRVGVRQTRLDIVGPACWRLETAPTNCTKSVFTDWF